MSALEWAWCSAEALAFLAPNFAGLNQWYIFVRHLHKHMIYHLMPRRPCVYLLVANHTAIVTLHNCTWIMYYQNGPRVPNIWVASWHTASRKVKNHPKTECFYWACEYRNFELQICRQKCGFMSFMLQCCHLFGCHAWTRSVLTDSTLDA